MPERKKQKKIQNASSEPRRQEPSDSPQLPPTLICLGNSPQTPLIPCERLDFNASLMRCVGVWARRGRGGRREDSTYLSTQTDWRADARPEWRVISASAELFKRNLNAFVAVWRRVVAAHLLRCPRWAFYFFRLPVALRLISTCDLFKPSAEHLWLYLKGRRIRTLNNKPGFHQRLISRRHRRPPGI